MKKLAYLTPFLAFALPAVASAQAAGNNLQGLITFFGQILNMLIPIMIALALIAFFWGLVKYVWSGGGEGFESAKNIMIAGIVALFVMVSVWGIIRLAQNTLGIQGGSAPAAPGVPQAQY